jgi:hypothetical protein
VGKRLLHNQRRINTYVDRAGRDGAAMLDWHWPSCYRRSARRLGERTLMVDGWGKCNTNNANPWFPDPYPGDGILAHKEGYNALYSDGSVRWIGDPQQTFIWRYHGSTGSYQINASSVHSWVFPGVTEFRLFDRAAGIDLTTTMYQCRDNPSVY